MAIFHSFSSPPRFSPPTSASSTAFFAKGRSCDKLDGFVTPFRGLGSIAWAIDLAASDPGPRVSSRPDQGNLFPDLRLVKCRSSRSGTSPWSNGGRGWLSGMLATSGHTATVVGIVGKDLDVKAGRDAAYTAALNVLALTKKQLGSLNRVSRVVRLGVYVAATPEFTEHPKVADAASELLRDVFGDQTVSSRLVLVSRAFHSVRPLNWRSSWK
jgi:enamine deaminase RidA (YjgF/YER057c/UK114 family)